MRNQIHLCNYRDEAQGALNVPLEVASRSIQIMISSSYFVGNGIPIILLTGIQQEILGIQLGHKLEFSLAQLRRGVELGPFGLLPAHTFQLVNGFCPIEGGLIRFGFLKKVFSWKNFLRALGRFVTAKLLQVRDQKEQVDLSGYWQSSFGRQSWGQFELQIKRDSQGSWRVVALNGQRVQKEIVARMSVNALGVVLGIESMQAY